MVAVVVWQGAGKGRISLLLLQKTGVCCFEVKGMWGEALLWRCIDSNKIGLLAFSPTPSYSLFSLPSFCWTELACLFTRMWVAHEYDTYTSAATKRTRAHQFRFEDAVAVAAAIVSMP